MPLLQALGRVASALTVPTAADAAARQNSNSTGSSFPGNSAGTGEIHNQTSMQVSGGCVRVLSGDGRAFIEVAKPPKAELTEQQDFLRFVSGEDARRAAAPMPHRHEELSQQFTQRRKQTGQ